MGMFTKIPQNTFEGLELEAGVLLKQFDPANPVAPADEDIICATTGGINPTCVPTYSDLGEDVDNCPNNMKELKHLDSWECKMAFTALHNSPAFIRLALGAADVDAETGAIAPRRDLSQDDFEDLWWVGDKANGGFVAIKLHNALSTGGFSLQTTKSGKGTVACELTGHVSIEDQDTMPMTFYSTDPEDADGGDEGGDTPVIEYEAVTPVGTENPSEEGWYELVNGEYVLSEDTAVDSGKTYYRVAEGA